MRVLVNSCVWGGVHQALVEAGHDAVWTGHWKEDPGDDEISLMHFRNVGYLSLLIRTLEPWSSCMADHTLE